MHALDIGQKNIRQTPQKLFLQPADFLAIAQLLQPTLHTSGRANVASEIFLFRRHKSVKCPRMGSLSILVFPRKKRN
jgi:hypothetical protein